MFEVITVLIAFALGELLIFLTLLHMLYKRRSPANILSWLLAMIILPYLAIFFYLIFGTRKRPPDKKPFCLSDSQKPIDSSNPIDGILRNNGIPGATSDNHIILYFDGSKAYQALITQIKSAKHSIFLSTYVFKHDAVTKEILANLIEKSRQGVKVRLLIDAIGSYQSYFFPKHLKQLKAAGGKVVFFMPFLQMRTQNYINLRNHRKIYLFDSTFLLSGGMNLTAEYLGPAGQQKRWNDLLFYAQGPMVQYYAEIFASDWAYASSTPYHCPDIFYEQCADTYLQVVPSGPDINGDPLYESLLSSIYYAKQRIWIVTPYFVPDEGLLKALIIAAHRGVDVILITPKHSNHLIADLARSSYMRELQEKGVKLALYNGSMLHAKAILIDSIGTMIGSVNFDYRSLFLNYEVACFAYSKDLIREMEKWMLELQNESTHGMKSANRRRLILENFMRILAPQL